MSSFDTWRQRFESAARQTLGPSTSGATSLADFIQSFTDERGHRRDVDQAFLMATLKHALPSNPSSAPPSESGGSGGASSSPPLPRSADVQLWQAVWDSSLEVDHLLETGDAAPLLLHPPREAIEVWTESELCALHALWRLARERARPEWRTRCEGAALWHVEHTQPDNATHHPWAIHVFAAIAAERANIDCDLYAQTMFHNAQVAMTGPDRFSAFILLDAANELAASK